jgi:putative DNA primase/helicase
MECSPYQTGYRWRQDCRTLHAPKFFFESTPRFKIIILGNHKPSLTDVTENERRRLHIIQLEFVPDKPDHDLADTLKGKAGGILEWMIEGACLWSEKGLENPRSSLRPQTKILRGRFRSVSGLKRTAGMSQTKKRLNATPNELFQSWQEFAENADKHASKHVYLNDRLRWLRLKKENKRYGKFVSKAWLGIYLNRREDQTEF